MKNKLKNKIVVVLLQAMIFPLLSHAQLPRLYDPQNGIFRFNGKVRSCKDSEYGYRINKADTIKTKKRQNPADRDFLVVFNAQGKISEQIFYGPNNHIIMSRQYIYSDTILKKIIVKQMRDSVISFSQISYLHNEQNKLIKTEEVKNDSSLKTKQIKKELIYENFVYDSVGRKKEIVVSGKEKESKTAFKYNQAGELVSENYYAPPEKLKSVTIYSYDENHRCTDLSVTGKQNYKLQFKYDKDEFPSEESDLRNGKLIWKQIYKRDQYNNKIEAKYIKANKTGFTLTFRFTYDAKGNWTNKKTFMDGRLIYVAERSFEYY